MQRGDLLFVYGTLRRGERADLGRNLQTDFISEDRINGKIFSVGWYPGVKTNPVKSFDPEVDYVVGDVFRLRDASIIAMLDAYEGYPSLFGRLQTVTEAGHKVWVYTYNHEVGDHQQLPGGDWKCRVPNNAASA